MKTPIRLYMVSLAAITILDRVEGEEQGALRNHHPAFILAGSIDEADAEAKKLVYQSYPESEGWSLQSAVISPVDAMLYQSIVTLQESNLFDTERDPSETMRTSSYDPNAETFDEIDGSAH